MYINGFAKLSLNIEKSSFVTFHPIQKKLDHNAQILLNDLSIKREYTIKYLGITTDCNLNWKSCMLPKFQRRSNVILVLFVSYGIFVNSHAYPEKSLLLIH